MMCVLAGAVCDKALHFLQCLLG